MDTWAQGGSLCHKGNQAPLFCDCRAHQLARFLYRIHCAVPAKDELPGRLQFFQESFAEIRAGIIGSYSQEPIYQR